MGLKITELTELAATPAITDILVVVDDPGGSPISKKITVANLHGALVSAAVNLTAEALAVGADGAKGIKALALGAANLKLFMNAAGSANEYANGMKIGTFTKSTGDASADQGYTGIGFKPSHIIFLAVIDSTVAHSIGFDNGTSHYAIDGTTTAGIIEARISHCIYMNQAAATYSGLIKSFDVDGFTITWTKTGAVTATIYAHYIAFR